MSERDGQGRFPASKNGETAHGDGCQCTRCIGFQMGNQVSATHGAYHPVRLAARAQEHATVIAELVPGGVDCDMFAVAGLALAAARLESASMALEALDGDDALRQYADGTGDRLHRDARAWSRLLLQFCEALSLTPASRARLGISVRELRRVEQTTTQYDLRALSDDEVATLKTLLEKAS